MYNRVNIIRLTQENMCVTSSKLISNKPLLRYTTFLSDDDKPTFEQLQVSQLGQLSLLSFRVDKK